MGRENVMWVVPRARIGLATPAFSGPRSTNELPRHGSSLRFYGKVAALKRENGLSQWAEVVSLLSDS